MPTLLADDWIVARKAHRCSACYGTIPAGERYRRQRIVDDGPQTFKAHALCDQLWWFLYREMGLLDDDALDPYDDIQPALLLWFTAVARPWGGIADAEGT